MVIKNRLALIFCRNEEFYVKIKFQGIVEAKEYRPYYGINTNSKNEGVEGNYTNNSIFVLITTNLVWVIVKNNIHKSN